MVDRRLVLRVAAKVLALLTLLALAYALFGTLSPNPDTFSSRPHAEPRDLPPPRP